MSYASPEGAPVPFPPDVQTPASDQLDDITYPGSEVTVINRTPDQPSGYWPKSGCFVPPNSGYHSMHPASPHTFTVAQPGRSYPFENESSSTLSCADGYQVQNQEEAMGGSAASFMCPSGQHNADAETLRDGAATMCDCNSHILLDGRGSVTSLDKNTPSSPTSARKHHHHQQDQQQQQQQQQQHHHQRKKHTSSRSSRSKRRRAGGEGAEEEGEDECSFFRRSGRRSHKASSGGLSHCLSEDDSLSRRQKRSSWGTRRSEYLRRSGKSRSPAERSNQCSDCAAACGTNRSWNSMASRHANSLPTLKKRQQNSPPCEFSERPLRNRKPVNGLFGFNLAAARAEEQWSDTELASAPARNGQMYKTVDSGCCGIICLSFICIVGVSCLFSPIGMLILPVVLSFTSQSKKTPVGEDFVSSSSALSLTDSDFLGSQNKLNSAGGITCNTRCEADLLSLGVKLIILCLTTWKLYVLPVVLVYRRLGIRPLSVSAILNRKLRAGCYKTKSKPVNPSSLHPYPIERPFAVTISVNFLSFGATCAFWVVFVARWVNSSGSAQRSTPLPDPTVLFGLDDVSSSPSSQTASLLAYSNLVSFVLTFADTQLVLHILGLILEGLQRVLTDKTVYVVQVVRSPDGHSRSYRVNGGSIDSVATELLHRYLVDFPVELPAKRVRQKWAKSWNLSGARSTLPEALEAA
ncbi:Vang-like protein 1 [Sparganum proliferum]